MTQETSEPPRVANINEFIFQVSEVGIKNTLHSDYKKRFKNILWTTDINLELPVKLASTSLSSMLIQD